MLHANLIPPSLVDIKGAGLSHREALLTICDEAHLWRSPSGEAYASTPVDDHVEQHAIASRGFRYWLLHRLVTKFSQNGRPASVNENTFRDVRSVLEAKAMIGAPTFSTPIRVTEFAAGIYIDLGRKDWSCVQITKDGSFIIPRAPVPILRSKRTGPFELPSQNGNFSPLRQLLGHFDEDTFILLVSWCLGALLPKGPYPLLVLGGEQGAGKSTLARLAQQLVDPVNGDLLQPPRDDRDLIAAAKMSHVLSFDNLSLVRAELADSFCRLATGAEIGGRALYTDSDMASFSDCRPIIINGIPDLAGRGDVADRSIILRLSALKTRVTERDWREAVTKILPSTFAALLNALSEGLKNVEKTATPNVRMADFARFVVAAEQALPWSPGAFMEAYKRSRLDATVALADGDSVVGAVLDFMANKDFAWSGSTSELYKILTRSVSIGSMKAQDWPGNARWFGDRLRRASPVLRAHGIDRYEWREGAGRMVTLRKIESLGTSTSFAASDPTALDRGSDANVASAPLSLRLSELDRRF